MREGVTALMEYEKYTHGSVMTAQARGNGNSTPKESKR